MRKKIRIIIFSVSGIIAIVFIVMQIKYMLIPTRPRMKHTTKIFINQLETAISMYKADFGQYPPGTNDNLFNCLTQTCLKSGETYIVLSEKIYKKGLFTDKWGNPLQYIQPGINNSDSYDIYSFGPNKKDEKGQGDDINNW